MPNARIVLLVLMFATAHAATLTDGERAALMDWRSGPQQLQNARKLAATLGQERRMEAADTLLEARSFVLMNLFVSSVLTGSAPPAIAPAEEDRALQLARDESYDLDPDSRMTRQSYFKLLRGYQSSELFNVFLDSARDELTAKRNAGTQGMMPRPRWYGLEMATMAQAPGMDAPLAGLLPLVSTACNGLQLVGYFRAHPYPPALPLLQDLYLRSSVDRTNYCTDQILSQLIAAQTRSATETMGKRILWLADQPDSTARDAELRRTIHGLGPIRADAQVNYDELRQQLDARPLTAQLHTRIDADLDEAARTARRAREFTLENLDFWIASANTALVADFLAHDVHPSGKDARGNTRFGLAIAVSQFQMALDIVQAGGDVSQEDLVTLCGMPAGALTGRGVDAEALLSTLVAHGVDVNGAGSKGWAPLHHAASAGNLPMLAALLSHHARVDIPIAAASGASQDPLDAMMGATPLHVAARTHQLAAAEYLLNHGANVNARTVRHATPLLVAVASGNALLTDLSSRNLPMAELLISHGANVQLTADEGVSPVLIAHESGNTDMEALLRSHGARINPVTLLKRKLIQAVAEAYASGMK